MSELVVDASVVAKWFFPEEHSAAALRLISARRQLIAPDLVLGEFGNVVWKRVGRGELARDEARRIVEDFLRLPLQIVPTHGLLLPAWELAVAVQRTVYDCLYLALAIARGCRLVTADEKLTGALARTPLARHLRLVGRRD